MSLFQQTWTTICEKLIAHKQPNRNTTGPRGIVLFHLIHVKWRAVNESQSEHSEVPEVLVCVWWYRRELTRAQLHESQLEMRSSLTSGIFCVGSNLPAGHKTHTSQRDHRRQQVLQRTDDPLRYLKQEYFGRRSQETKSCSYRPCLLLLSFFSKIQSRPFFADLPFMFLNRHLQRDTKWPSSLFKIHLTVCVKLHPELKLWFWISCIDLDVTVKGRKSCLMGLWVRRHNNLCLISVGLLASSKQVWQNLH